MERRIYGHRRKKSPWSKSTRWWCHLWVIIWSDWQKASPRLVQGSQLSLPSTWKNVRVGVSSYPEQSCHRFARWRSGGFHPLMRDNPILNWMGFPNPSAISVLLSLASSVTNMIMFEQSPILAYCGFGLLMKSTNFLVYPWINSYS